MSKEFKIVKIKDSSKRSEVCSKIINLLPEWFGIPQQNIQYASNAATMHNLAMSKADGQVVGMLVYQRREINTMFNSIFTEIYWMGVVPEFQGRGLGKSLVDKLIEQEKSNGHAGLLVETLSPEENDINYLKTYKFYEKMGFVFWYDKSFDSGEKAVVLKLDF